MFYLFFFQVIFLSPEMYRYQIENVTIEMIPVGEWKQTVLRMKMQLVLLFKLHHRE